jgi:hypothetical protein
VSGWATGPDALVFQQNDYYASGGTLAIVWGSATYASVADWRAATGQERLGSTPTGLAVDPRLMRAGGGSTIGDPNRLASLTAYQLRADSPLRGVGLDLPGLFGVATGGRDYYGVPVPSGNGPEIGASEID